VLLKKDYEKIKIGRSYFGDFDPFGEFDLLFGAARLGLKIVEVPVGTDGGRLENPKSESSSTGGCWPG
jgi:hypothetical protein